MYEQGGIKIIAGEITDTAVLSLWEYTDSILTAEVSAWG